MMRVLFLLCCGAAASAAVTEPRVLLKLSPLIGGPKLLRFHSQLFVDSGAGIDGWDFVPKDATAPATLARLLTLRAAPGDARRLVANDGVGMFDVGARPRRRQAISTPPSPRGRRTCTSCRTTAGATRSTPRPRRSARTEAGPFGARRRGAKAATLAARGATTDGARRRRGGARGRKVEARGTSLAGLFSEEDRARAGASIKAALADEAEPPGNAVLEIGVPHSGR